MVTDQQVRRLRMLANKGKSRSIAAAKAGMSEKMYVVKPNGIF